MPPLDVLLVAKAHRALDNGQAVTLRKTFGLSQEQVADFCEVSDATVSRWESGIRRPRAGAATRLGWLLESLEEMAAEMPSAQTNTSGTGQALK